MTKSCYFVITYGSINGIIDISYRPANSQDSAVSLTIFKLFSQPHDKSLNLTAFWEISV